MIKLYLDGNIFLLDVNRQKYILLSAFEFEKGILLTFLKLCIQCRGVVGLTSQGIVRHCQSRTILCSPRGQPGILRLPPARPFQRLFYYRKGEASSELRHFRVFHRACWCFPFFKKFV